MLHLIVLMIYGGYFDIDGKKARLSELDSIMSSSDFWNDINKSNEIIEESNSLKKTISDTVKVFNGIKEIKDMLLENLDCDTFQMLCDEYEGLSKEIDDIELILLLSGEHDKSNCILEVHSGAGGTEACDWANMIYRMYQRYCEKSNYKCVLLDYQEGDETGIKSVSMLVKGDYAYGYLKCEKGIHRLVRLSPFDANHKRHTSFASVDVTPEIDKSINVVIDEKDLKIDVYRSSGCGGQGVNTTDSAVRITHLPTKIVVTCQNERSQLQNKEQAMSMLKNKLYLLEEEKKKNELKNIKGDLKNIEFGSQIRSYVMHPYSMVKDHRTDYETSNVDKVLDGDLSDFIEAELKVLCNEE